VAEDEPNNGAPGTQAGPYEGPRATDFTPEPDHSDDPGYITRTKFLSTVAIAGGGILTAAILVPVAGFAVASSLRSEKWRWVDIGPASDFLQNAPPYPNAEPSTKIGEVASLAVAGPDPEADRRIYVMFGLTNPSAKPVPGPNESTAAYNTRFAAWAAGLTAADMVVLHDDIAFEPGQMRLSQGGSAAGHNGIASCIQHFGEAFLRARLGIGPKRHPAQDLADHVLGKFPAEDLQRLHQATPDFLLGLETLLSRGLPAAQNFTNRKPPLP
jgi:hypothetical protein